MGLAHNAVAAAGRALRSLRAGQSKLASRKMNSIGAFKLAITSPDFMYGGPLPRWTTAEGDGKPPALRFSGIPASARSLVVICEDPDAPLPRPFVHHLVYGIPATATGLDADNLASMREGLNTKLEKGYAPLAPPAGHGPHRYHFQVFALDGDLALESGGGRDELLKKMTGHVVGFGEIVGTYERR